MTHYFFSLFALHFKVLCIQLSTDSKFPDFN